jgi:4-amino-4-deoxy-L-arabinose transferase-like glycosyltransferase
MDETMENSWPSLTAAKSGTLLPRYSHDLIVLAFASAVFLGSLVSPPSLMDDVDAVQAQIARNMLESGDWVTARLDGVAYLEKAPLPYWIMAASFRLLGVSDWAARLPMALGVVALCLLTRRFGRWAFGDAAGLYSGLALSTCVGLFLFTRILIPDALLTLTITLGLWAFLRALEEDEPHPRRWATVLAASLAAGLLLKGLIALVFPLGAAFLYLLLTGQFWRRRTWQRLHPGLILLGVLLIAAPWHVLATLRNPPYFDFTLRSVPGEYHGFFWFYFLNEHVFRFLGMRHPRDYNTVPRLWFWLLQGVWLFPWSVFLPAAARLGYRAGDRAGRTRLLALCLIGLVMVFFTLSTTQEYYSMPIYPWLALLIGSALASAKGEDRWALLAPRLVGALAAMGAVAAAVILFQVWGVATPGDIASALAQNPELYTLSLGHIYDLTQTSFAYLRMPLAMAGVAFLLGALALWRLQGHRAWLAMALMMVVFLQAANRALVVFDPYLSSRPLAAELSRAPARQLIVDGQYYTFSSVFFYANRQALLWNGRVNNLEYGSYAPGAPQVFIGDAEFLRLWAGSERHYLLAEAPRRERLRELIGADALHVVKESGGKFLFTNRPLASSQGYEGNAIDPE